MESSFFATIFVLALALGAQGQNTAFDYFLYDTLEGYHDWAVAKGLEPIVLEEPVVLTMDYERYYYVAEIRYLLNYICSKIFVQATQSNSNLCLRNHTIYGAHSVSYSYSESSVSDSRIKLMYHNIFRPNMVFGQYTINGTMFGEIPITGSGPVNSSVESAFDIQFIQFRNFEVVDDHIVLANASAGYPGVHVMGFIIQFEGLDAGGYEEEVMRLLAQSSYRPAINPMLRSILYNHLKMYLEEVFAATPVSEIDRRFSGKGSV